MHYIYVASYRNDFTLMEELRKKEEIEILEQAYKKEVLKDLLIESETPDFILTDRVNGKKIGIEVTTVFSHPSGSLLNSEKFAKTFIEKNKPRKIQKKKKSQKLKNIGVASIKGAQGAFHDDYVIYQINSLKDYLQFFEDLIKKKEKAYEINPKGLEFVNLVAKDKGLSFRTHRFEISGLYNILRQDSIFDTIIRSHFQEIVFITAFKEHLYNIPLKWYLFTCEYLLFNKFWKESKIVKESMKEDLVNKMNNFLIILKHLGFKKIYINREEEIRYIFFGDHYYKFDTINNTVEEVSFLALELNKLKNLEDAFKEYKEYSLLFEEYQKFRKTIVPNIPEGAFRKLT